MSAKEAPVIYEDSALIIRGEWRKNGSEFCLFAHPKPLGEEQRPRGYWLGSNALIFENPLNKEARAAAAATDAKGLRP